MNVPDVSLQSLGLHIYIHKKGLVYEMYLISWTQIIFVLYVELVHYF